MALEGPELGGEVRGICLRFCFPGPGSLSWELGGQNWGDLKEEQSIFFMQFFILQTFIECLLCARYWDGPWGNRDRKRSVQWRATGPVGVRGQPVASERLAALPTFYQSFCREVSLPCEHIAYGVVNSHMWHSAFSEIASRFNLQNPIKVKYRFFW